jgi:FkbM family methyltransferase
MSVFTRLAQAFDGKSRATFEEFFETYLRAPTDAARDRLFEAYFSSGAKTLLHARAAREQFIVESGDNFMARDLFVSGSSQFDRVEEAFDILRRDAGVDPAQRTLIDIGANIGVISIPIVARGLCRSAIAIEPSPSVCRILRANVALNGLEKAISVYETALADFDGEAQFEISEDNTGDNRIAVASAENTLNEDKRAKISVRMSRFDTLFKDLDLGQCLIWMDVQGYEGKVLSGAKNILAARPPMVSEFWPYGMRRAQSYELMREALSGYARFCVLDGKRRWRPLSELDALRDSITGLDHTDILCLAS